MELTQLIKQIPVFNDLSKESIYALSEQAEIKVFSRGDNIIRFGEEGRVLGFLVSGEAEAARTFPDGTKERFGVLKPWEVFGEMALMTGEPTTADVTALTSTHALLISHKALHPIIAREPSLAASLAKIISRRLVARERSRREQERLAEARRAQEDPYSLYKFPLPEGGRILTINCGSSSLKYRLFDSHDPSGGLKGYVERVGLSGTRHVFEQHGKKFEEPVEGKGYNAAFKAMVNALGGKESLVTVNAVGHRVVHGGKHYRHAMGIDEEVIEAIRKCERLAPLHIPANLAGIEEAMRRMPAVPHVAVFDTGFHRTIPRYAHIYGIPYRFYEADGVRRYGFHGMSHKFVCLQTATFLKRPVNEFKLISCHLGNGASLAAVDHGRCIDTSMGMTPLEGPIMGTRPGDIDPGVLLYLMKKHDLTASEMETILMKESGLLGISGVSSDMRELLQAATNGHARALRAIQTFCYRVKKYIGAYWAALGELDVLIFTGGIGERSPEIRARVCQGLAGIGVVIDEQANHSPDFDDRGAAIISTEESPVKILVVPTDEERMIARETARAISRVEITRIMRSHDKALPIGVSAHHVHLSREHVEALFGKGRKLTFNSPLSQPGQFSCQEQVTLIGPKGRIERVRILGPDRKASQVEISRTEEFELGIDAPVRMSGDLEGTPGVTIEGSAGFVDLENGVICARRHIHMTPEDALRFGIRDGDVVMVEVEGERALIFSDVTVRVAPHFKIELHLDTDEANAAGVNTGMSARLRSIQSRW
jgi:acetate kinase